MNEMKDKGLREALKQKEARRIRIEVPADFCDSIMQEIGVGSQEVAPLKDRPVRWRWMAAAASILLIIGIGAMVWLKETGVGSQETGVGSEANIYVAQNVEPSPRSENPRSPSTVEPAPKQKPTEKTSAEPPTKRIVQDQNTSKSESDDPIVPPVKAQSSPTDKNLLYAASKTTDDALYQDPARVDEFIAKLADYNHVKSVSLDCSPGSDDNPVICKAYVFEDKEDVDLFGRLLNVACCYDSKTSGYMLKISHQQLFFTLKDQRKGQKYLWMAERINGGRILLTSTRSSVDFVPSSACYQEYRNKLTQQLSINTKALDI